MYEQINEIKSRENRKHFSVFCSFLQIYNEKVFDLLNSSSITNLGGAKKIGDNSLKF